MLECPVGNPDIFILVFGIFWVVELKPFKRLRYNIEAVGSIGDVVTLPYDIITPEKQERYYRQSEHNYVRLILAREEDGDNGDSRYESARRTLDKWMAEGVLVEDEDPGLFIYEEEFDFNGGRKRQAGIVGLVKLEPFEKGVILPHEKVYNTAIEDRYSLLKATRSCLEMIIGVFSDRERRVLEVMRKYVSEAPELDFEHEDEVRHRLWKITDKDDLDSVISAFRDDKVIIADGHHRYTTALKYYSDSGDERAGYMLFLLWSMEDDLKVLPTHRLLKRDSFDSTTLEGLEGFEVEDVDSGLEGLLARMGDSDESHVFGVYDGGFHLLKLVDGGHFVLDESKSMAWNGLDVNIMRSKIIKPLLSGENGECIDRGDLAFTKDARKAVEKVDAGEYDVAFFLNPPSIDEIRDVVDAGERMPQKSTYFYPKPLSGILMCRL
ncbi:MAG: DUF1015 family protein [Candidatus Altiarchaeales archaeon]|nr:DUF1015 family protein [Candidatus Altiarchaeales archaeon]MBD3415914.1 DUF1015 family protein [Candidatus Altiarchaeales archaeon]